MKKKSSALSNDWLLYFTDQNPNFTDVSKNSKMTVPLMVLAKAWPSFKMYHLQMYRKEQLVLI